MRSEFRRKEAAQTQKNFFNASLYPDFTENAGAKSVHCVALRFAFFIFVAALFLSFFGCVRQTISARNIIGAEPGEPIYTAYNIFYKDPLDVPSINFLDGKLLPVGTRVEILETVYYREDRADIIKFKDVRTGQEFRIVHHKKWRSNEDSPHRLIKDLFTTKSFESVAKDFDPEIVAQIKDGKISKGMTRQQVAIAWGPPATHRTSSLDSSTWMYWKAQDKTIRVIFGKDKVKHIME